MSNRFDRRVRVAIAFDPEPSTKQAFTRTYRQRATIENLRVQFNVVKSASDDPNPASVIITNLSAEHRSLFERKPLHLTLEAGYVSGMSTLYKGDVMRAQSVRNGPDWETTVQLGSGAYLAKHARSNISLPSGAKLKDTIVLLAKDAGLKIPTNITEAKEFVEGAQTGQTLQGPSLKLFQGLVGVKGYDASMQDDNLIVVKRGRNTLDVVALVISQATGMVGSPELGAPEDDGGPPVLSVKTLLDGAYQVGAPIVVKSRGVNGNFKVQRIEYSGDTHGQAWYTMIEATPI